MSHTDNMEETRLKENGCMIKHITKNEGKIPVKARWTGAYRTQIKEIKRVD